MTEMPAIERNCCRMKRNDTTLYIFVGLVSLGIASIYIEIKSSIIVSISIAMLFFSIGQFIESIISYNEENMKNALEVNNKTKITNLTEQEMLIMKSLIQNFNPDKKKRVLKAITIIVNSIAFVVFFLGFVIPINIDPSINAAVTIFSASAIFLSMWMTEWSIRRTEQWEEVLKIMYLNLPSNMAQQPEDLPETMEAEKNSED